MSAAEQIAEADTEVRPSQEHHSRITIRIARWYIRGMKVKTSVTLSEELLNAIAAETDQSKRSAFIEEAAWRYLRERERDARDRRELELINEHADELNAEARQVLEFQAGE